MTEYVWSSPGGLYVVPDEWRQRFLAEFPGYRVRWSLQRQQWQVEQPYGNPLPHLRNDPFDDTLIRRRDGFWLVMAFQPGNRMPCPGIIDRGQRCGMPISVATRRTAESVCAQCKLMRRDGRTMASYWPFDECLLEHLRFTDPLRGGIQRARQDVDLRNATRERRLERDASNAVQAHAADLHRHVVGIKQWSGTHTSHPREDGRITMRTDED